MRLIVSKSMYQNRLDPEALLVMPNLKWLLSNGTGP